MKIKLVECAKKNQNISKAISFAGNVQKTVACVKILPAAKFAKTFFIEMLTDRVKNVLIFGARLIVINSFDHI